MSLGQCIEMTDDIFEQILEEHDLVFVLFWADWSTSCQKLLPLMEDLASEYQGDVTFGLLEVESNPHSMDLYEVNQVPTLAVFKYGEVVEQYDEKISARTIRKTIDDLLDE